MLRPIRTGFSFLFANPPSFKRLVVALGTPEDPIHIGAEVMHSTAVQYQRTAGSLKAINSEACQVQQVDELVGAGRRMFLVGCRFMNRPETMADGSEETALVRALGVGRSHENDL